MVKTAVARWISQTKEHPADVILVSLSPRYPLPTWLSPPSPRGCSCEVAGRGGAYPPLENLSSFFYTIRVQNWNDVTACSPARVITRP